MRLLVCLAVATLTSAVFLPSLSNGWVHWDDDHNFLENPAYRGLGPTQLRWMFTTFHLGPYQPLSWLTLGLDYLLWGMDPRGYHLTSVLLHAAGAAAFAWVAMLLFDAANPRSTQTALQAAPPGATTVPSELVMRGIPAEWFGAGVALLWTLHPLRVESVSWITERRDVLCALFCLLTIAAHLRGRGRLTVAGLALAAMLAKGTAVTLPVLLVLVDLYASRSNLSPLFRAALRRHAPVFAMSLLFGGLAVYGQYAAGGTVSLADAGWTQRMSLCGYSLAFYAWRTIWPADLVPIYEAAPTASQTVAMLRPAALAAVAMFALAGLLALRLRRTCPAMGLLLVAYLALVLPISGIVKVGPHLVADRYAHQPGWTLALAVAGVLAGLARRAGAGVGGAPRPVRACVAFALPIAAACALLTRATVAQQHIWRDTESLWTHQLAVAPDTANAHYNLALEYLRRQPPDEARAESHLAAALAKFPNYVAANGALGDLLRRQGRTQEAQARYRSALAAEPRAFLPRRALAELLWQTGTPDAAIGELQQIVALFPGSETAHLLLARALAAIGRPADAVAAYQRGIDQLPGSAALLLDFARLLSTHPLRSVRDGSRALDLAQRALRLTGPGDPLAVAVLASAHAERGDFDAAISVLNQAVLSAHDVQARELENLALQFTRRQPLRVEPRFP